MTYEAVFKAMLTTPIGEFFWVFIRAALMALGVGLVLTAMGLVGNPAVLLLFPIIGGILALPCAAIGLLAASKVKNINQFQTVYSFLIAPIYYLSGVFFPIADGTLLHKIAQFSPFYHGVRLLQIATWQRGEIAEISYHLGALAVFGLILGLWADFCIRKKLTS